MRIFGLTNTGLVVDEGYEPRFGEAVIFVPLSMDEVIALKKKSRGNNEV